MCGFGVVAGGVWRAAEGFRIKQSGVGREITVRARTAPHHAGERLETTPAGRSSSRAT